MTRVVELPQPDPTVHPVGADHSGKAARQQRALLEYCGLRPSSHLLEIGCGIGRLVYELAPFLDEGTYVGFDIAPAAIAWLNEHYEPKLPNFTFDLLEVRNARYNPRATAEAAAVRLPYRDDQFDFACSFSVFTHMRMPEIQNYLRELRRVLAPGGRGVMTFFSIMAEDTDPQLAGKGERFVPIGDGAYTTSPELPERAIAFDDALIRTKIAEAGLSIVEVVQGRWHGRPTEGPSFHKDAFVLTPA